MPAFPCHPDRDRLPSQQLPDPAAKTLRAVEGIVADADFASDYASLRRDMVYGVAADFETAIATLKTLANTLKERRA